MRANAARIMPDLKAFKKHRIAPLQNFRVGQAAIRHMRMHRVGAIKIRAGPGSTTQGFIILIGRIAVKEIIHRTLGSRHHPQSAI